MCDVQAIVGAVCQQAGAMYGDRLESVILYGSYARGDFHEESDIDIMILVRLPKEELQQHREIWSSLSSDLDLTYHALTSLKLQDADSFYARRDILPFFQNVWREGVRYSA